jgi:hypothetical protein
MTKGVSNGEAMAILLTNLSIHCIRVLGNINHSALIAETQASDCTFTLEHIVTAESALHLFDYRASSEGFTA